jgi:hypothetical protein
MKRKVLIVFSGTLVVLAALATYGGLQVRATPGEQAMTLPGDGLIAQPIGSVNHAISIRRSPHEVWPWLVQMGSGRAGWYAYDFIDNGSHRSADRILPEFQNIEVGSVLPALPGVSDVFTVVQARRISSIAHRAAAWW